jgi:hypothetical protein
VTGVSKFVPRSKHVVSAIERAAVLQGQEGAGLSERPLASQGGQLVSYMVKRLVYCVGSYMVSSMVSYLVSHVHH